MTGGEELAYFKGGFGRLAEALVTGIRQHGGQVSLGSRVTGIEADGAEIVHVNTDQGVVREKISLYAIVPHNCGYFDGLADPQWVKALRRVKYLGNMCLVLRLNQSLSETYWLNVNDPAFHSSGSLSIP